MSDSPNSSTYTYFDDEIFARKHAIQIRSQIRSRNALFSVVVLFCIIVPLSYYLWILFNSGNEHLYFSDYPKLFYLVLIISLVLTIVSVAAYLLINYLQIGKFIATRDNIDAYALSPILESRNIYPKNITAPEENKEKPEISSLVERRSQIEITSARFNQEIRDLGRRGNVNLVIGIVTTLAGVTALVYVVFGESEINSIDFSRYAIHFVLRLSIALFIEVFAYFFLRLYKSNLDDIKYYQNEITNIELKLTALDTALKLSNTAASKTAIEEILKTERNFILKRGETTYLLEREKMEKNDILDIVKEAINTIRKIK